MITSREHTFQLRQIEEQKETISYRKCSRLKEIVSAAINCEKCNCNIHSLFTLFQTAIKNFVIDTVVLTVHKHVNSFKFMSQNLPLLTHVIFLRRMNIVLLFPKHSNVKLAFI